MQDRTVAVSSGLHMSSFASMGQGLGAGTVDTVYACESHPLQTKTEVFSASMRLYFCRLSLVRLTAPLPPKRFAYCLFILALIFYEYAITFAQEVAVVWRQRFSPVSLLLVCIRWTLLLEALFLVLPQPMSHVSPTLCALPTHTSNVQNPA